ncbi:MAG: response regulator [Bacteroidetes bacterium]|nr:MAG: response regulator [Bacteroidota bacterium]
MNRKTYLIFVLCLLLLPLAGVASQDQLPDSLRHQYGLASHPKAKIQIIHSGIAPHFLNYNLDSAAVYLQKAVSLADSIIRHSSDPDTLFEYRTLKAQSLRSLGNAYHGKGLNEPALEAFYEALEISKSYNDLSGVARAELNIGNVLNREGLNDQALEFFIRAYNKGEAIGEKRFMAYAANNIGNVYMNKGDAEQAVKYYQTSIDLKEEINDLRGMINSYNNIGLIYKNRGEFEKSIEYYQISLDIVSQLDHRQGLSMVLSNLALLHVAMAEKAMESNDYASRDQNFRSAVHLGERALVVAREVGSLPRESSVAERLMKAHRGLRQYEKALDYAQLYIQTRDSLFNEEKTTIIAEMQARFESQQQLQEIHNQQLIIERQEAEYQSQLTQRNLLLVLILFLISVTLLLWFQFRSRKKTNELINEKNDMLESAYEELQTANEELQTSNEELVAQQEIIRENLEKKIAVATQMLEFKQKFMAQISHEIRTPLTGVLGITEALSNTPLNEEQIRYLEILQYSGESLIGIINDVLDFSKIEAGKLELKTKVFSIKEMLQSSVSLFAHNARETVSLELDLPDDMPEYIEADELRLGQVIRNLLSNAVKFTDKGKVKLSAQVIPDGNDGQAQLKINVTDTGPGIDKSQIDKLFKPFSQLSRNHLRPVEGTGLGLSICKEIVEKHGGEIGVISEPGSGSDFWFSVKISVRNNPEDFRPKSVSSKSPFESKLKILLVEDLEVNRRVITLLLTGMKHQVVAASNGHEAVELYQPGAFDLILMDVEMPVMDGIEAARTLKAKYNHELPPIVGLSANALEGDREKYIEQGMDEYLTKPFNVNAFMQIVEKFFVS